MNSTRSTAATLKDSWAAQRKSLKPKTFDMSSEALVRIEQIEPDAPLPLVVTPALPGVDLITWADNNLELIEQKLRLNGGLLFRGDRGRMYRETADWLASARMPELLGR